MLREEDDTDYWWCCHYKVYKPEHIGRILKFYIFILLQ